MSQPNPEHLFEQAEALAIPARAGAPRQVDLRRAISSAYYGLFHATLTAAADEFVGSTRRSTPSYRLAYRSVDHKTLRDVCIEARKTTATNKFKPYVPAKGFGLNIQAFAAGAIDLQERRVSADYDPVFRVRCPMPFWP